MAESQNLEQPNLESVEGEPSVEQVEGVKVEKEPDGPEKIAEKTAYQPAPDVSIPPPGRAVPAPKRVKSETLEKIEYIMEEDLAHVYKEMPPDIQREFREKGEETAMQIESMMYKVKIHSKKIFKLLFGWLKIIPGVNRFFLKQEAKLKTDEIMHLKEEIEKSIQNK